MFAIAAGSAIGQLLALAAAPLYARFYSPTEFGVFTIVSSIALTFGAVVSLRYEMAVPLPRSDETARDLIGVGAVLCFVSGVVLSVVAVVLAGPLGRLLGGAVGAGELLAAVGIAVLVGLYRLLNQWALRQRLYAAVARRNAVQAAVTAVVQVAAGGARLSSGLTIGLAAGQLAGVLSLLRGSRLFEARTDRPRYRDAARRYRSFALLLAPAGLINNAGQYAPIVLIASLYGTEAGGLVGFAQRVLGVPVALIGQSVAQVYLSELAKASREDASDRGHQLFWTATKRLGLVALTGTVVLVVLGPPLFAFVFGERWRMSGSIAQAMSLVLAGQLIASSLSQTLIVYERTVLQFAWDLSRLTVTVAAVIIAHSLGADLLNTVWVFSLASTATYLWSWELSRRTISRHPRAAAGGTPG